MVSSGGSVRIGSTYNFGSSLRSVGWYLTAPFWLPDWFGFCVVVRLMRFVFSMVNLFRVSWFVVVLSSFVPSVRIVFVRPLVGYDNAVNGRCGSLDERRLLTTNERN